MNQRRIWVKDEEGGEVHVAAAVGTRRGEDEESSGWRRWWLRRGEACPSFHLQLPLISFLNFISSSLVCRWIVFLIRKEWKWNSSGSRFTGKFVWKAVECTLWCLWWEQTDNFCLLFSVLHVESVALGSNRIPWLGWKKVPSNNLFHLFGNYCLHRQRQDRNNTLLLTSNQQT